MKLLNRTGKNRKKSSLLAALCFFTALALLLSGGAVTLARYIQETQRDGLAVAKPFYFSSDKLEEEPQYYQLDSTGGTSVEIRFQLRNYVDKLRCTDVNFSCEYKVTAEDGTVLDSGTRSFTGGAQKDEQISLTADSAYFAGDKRVTVTASTQSPYQKTISAQFGFAKGQEQLQWSVSQQGGAMVLEIGGGAGNSVTVSWPDTLVPDRSNSVLAGADATSVTFQIESGVRYALAFLKTDPTISYTEKDFTITQNE